jgi:hypothetical protein
VNWGIQLDESDNNIIKGNILTNDQMWYSPCGIGINSYNGDLSENNIISENDISGYYMGIGIAGGNMNNKIYHNNFLGNTINAYDEGSNPWYDVTLQQGNYWSDYTTQHNPPHDTQLPFGVWDDPYTLSGRTPPNQDIYPLANIYNNPPNEPSITSPQSGSINVPIQMDLSWIGGDPDTGDTLYYDVYFGTINPPPKCSNHQTDTIYDPGTLQYSSIYYWQIVSWDNHGAFTSSPIWSFTTETPNHNPDVPSIIQIITGPTTRLANSAYSYGATSTDPDGDKIEYGWDWNDGSLIEWTDMYPSSAQCTIYHSFLVPGTYAIQVKAQDSFGAESGWSETLQVRVVYLGDMDGDGIVGFGDINPFVLALSNPQLYKDTFNLDQNIVGDINQDGVCDFGDINPFVSMLSG